MSQIDCNACSDLKTNAPGFVAHGVESTECTSLAADTGLNPNLSPTHTDAADLHDVNDCLIGSSVNDLEEYGVCDWQDFMSKFIPNLYETLKGIICALGGAWTKIHNLLTRVGNLETRMTAAESDISGLKTRMTTAEGTITTLQTTVAGHTTAITNLNTKYNSLKSLLDDLIEAISGSTNTIPVFRKYSYTVPVSKFIQTWQTTSTTEQGDTATLTAWFSGSPQQDEDFISIPVTEMETIIGVWAQPKVVPGGNTYDGMGKDFMQTVAVQTYVHQGNNLIVNFDALELAPEKIGSHNGGPYPLPIEFLVVGTKTIET